MITVELITKQDLDELEKRLGFKNDELEKRLGFKNDELEKRLRSDIRKDINEDFEKKMRLILTEELPKILEHKFVTRDEFREIAR